MLNSRPIGGDATHFGADASLNSARQQANAGAPVFVQYFEMLKRWKWVVVAIVAGFVILGLLVTLLMTPQYTAISRLEINREKRQLTAGEGLESSEASRDLEFYQTQYALLESRSLAERVARRLKLSSNERFFSAHGTRPEGEGAFDGLTDVLSSDQRAEVEGQVTELLLKHVSIRPLRGSALIDVAYTSSSPEISSQISNAWSQEFIQSSLDRRFSSASAAREFLENRLSTLRERLEDSERELVNYASDQQIVSLPSAGASGFVDSERTLVSSDLDALNQALVGAKTERIAAESRLREGNSELSYDLLANSAITSLRQNRAEVAAEYARLSSQFEPGYPALDAVAQKLDALDESIAREESRVRATRVSARTDEVRQAQQKEARLRDQVEELKARLETQRRAGIQYNIYKRDVDTNRELYNGLLQRYKEIGVAGVGANNISIVDPAQSPDEPSSPNLPLNLALALLAGLVISGATVFALEQIDEGLKDPGDVAKLLNQPLLGGVPRAMSLDTIDELADSKSDLSEAYLSIWSNLAFSTDHGMPSTMAVTSTRPAEGKSTSSVALAFAVARTGKRVIVLDGDMRSPSMAEFLDRSNDFGFSNFLTGNDDWRSLVQSTAIGNVDLLAAGPKPPSAAELLSSTRSEELIQILSQHYDFVIIDAPPVLGLADAPLLARHVQGSVFVAEVESAAVREIRASIERLNGVQANVLGVILTKLSARSHGYGYGYGYGYGHDRDALDASEA